ncbi:hypothetical protein [uncultured Thiodictyon sp.]|uniref:hypothetical protein n=1 Tax=uncultured Thiodictyon sp. TaxID=1846217 RepID=UPI0025FD3887|nr:hypothetical protein [uncultured Thiodictyon sp.]
MTSSDREIRHLRNAAKLLLDVDGLLQDHAFEETGGQVIYAVDTDIVHLYLSPPTNARYADVFHQGHTEQSVVLLAWLLCDLIFDHRCGFAKHRPFVLVPPHDEELQRTADALQRKLLQLTERVENEMGNTVLKLRQLIQDSTTTSPDAVRALAERLAQEAPRLIASFQERREGPELELKRFADLARANAFIPMEALIVPALGCSLPCPDVARNIEHSVKFNATKTEWRKALTKHRDIRKPAYAIEADAEVLARLDWINNNPGTRDQIRLVLITGSHDIFLAARDLETGPDYAAKYLRHPRSFLGLRDAFAILRENDSAVADSNSVKVKLNVVEWLNLFFPEAVRLNEATDRTASVDRKLLQRWLKDDGSGDIGHWKAMVERLRRVTQSTSLDDYVSEWGKHVRNVTVARSILPKFVSDNTNDQEAIAEGIVKRAHDTNYIAGNAPLYDAVYCSSVKSLSRNRSDPPLPERGGVGALCWRIAPQQLVASRGPHRSA